MAEMFDPAAALKPLLEHSPGVGFQATCGTCGKRIIGICALTPRGFVRHPDCLDDESTPTPPVREPDLFGR